MYEHTDAVLAAFDFLWGYGFTFQDYYTKSTDTCCVFVYRFEKNERNYIEFRCPTGGNDVNFVVCVQGEKKFPAIRTLYAKRIREFQWKHLFKKPTVAERWALAAEIFRAEAQNNSLFGISLK